MKTPHLPGEQIELFEKGPSPGEVLFRRIGDCQQRIHERCDQLGIPRRDMIQSLTDCVADMRYHCRKDDPQLHTAASQTFLRSLLRRLLLKELALQSESGYCERDLDAADRIRNRATAADTDVMPLVRHLEPQLQTLSNSGSVPSPPAAF